MEKKTCHTPTPGKKPTAIPRWKYDLIRKAILQVLPDEPPGAVAKDLPKLVRPLLSPNDLERLGSVAWHTTTVKLNMEVENEIQRIPGVKPQHLIRLIEL